MTPDKFLGELDRGRLRELAREYHDRCEVYDRTVCTGGVDRDGTARPLGVDELGLVNRHALALRLDAFRRGEALGFTVAEVRRAIGEAA